jgi:glycosyltransferase involved in cell wall biosynthesis
MANPKDQLAEIEEKIQELEWVKKVSHEREIDNKILYLKAKLQGFLLGTISQLKEEIMNDLSELWQMFGYISVIEKHETLKELAKITEKKIEDRTDRITADLKFYEDKLKELEE